MANDPEDSVHASTEANAHDESNDERVGGDLSSRFQHQKGSTADRVHGSLVEAIEEGTLEPSVRLAEESLALVFGVSRTPVREALVRLQAEGLVERDRYGGLFLSRVTAAQTIELYVVREALDGVAARLAAQHAQQLDLEQMRRINNQLREAAIEERYADMAVLNIEFHTVMARASGNLMIQRFVGDIHGWVRRFHGTTFTYPGRAMEAVEEHERILEAVSERRGDDAESIARDHMRRSLAIRIKIEADG